MTNINVKTAIEAIDDKVGYYSELYSYLDGNPPLRYSTERLKRAFGKSFVYFAQNWAGVIINAVLDRLILKGFDIGNDSLNNKMDEIFTRLNLSLEAQDVHEALQVTGEAFLIVDKTEAGVEVYFNDPRMCEVFYNPDKPKEKLFAAKKWDASGQVRLNLYYIDRTEKYIGDKKGNLKLMETVPNETGVIPVFHFRNSRRVIKGELDASVTSELDAINSLFSDMMVSAEYYTYPMRVFISPSDPGNLSVGPDAKIWMPEGDIKQFNPVSLDGFTDPINNLANALSVQTRTPKHFFLSQGDAGLSGEALLTMESPLVKKVQKKQEAYSPTWQEAMAYILSLMGSTVDANDLVTVWQPVQSELPLTNAQIMKTEVEAGVPVINSARRLGWDEASILQLEEDTQPQADTNTQ